jgi:hypothetical protein
VSHRPDPGGSKHVWNLRRSIEDGYLRMYYLF